MHLHTQQIDVIRGNISHAASLLTFCFASDNSAGDMRRVITAKLREKQHASYNVQQNHDDIRRHINIQYVYTRKGHIHNMGYGIRTY